MPVNKIPRLLFLIALLVLAPAPTQGADGEPDKDPMEEDVAFPDRLLFKPLLAYYKEPKFFMSYLATRVRNPVVRETTVGAVGYGGILPLYEWRNTVTGNGMQIGFGGGAFAQFDLETPSDSLINTDYTVGVPIMVRKDAASYRFTFYHQSSHLGDELLLSSESPSRINLSYEALQLIASRNFNNWRLYLGYEYLVHKKPKELDANIAHAGCEYHASRPLLGTGVPVAGIHLIFMEEHEWEVDANLRLGLQFNRRSCNSRLCNGIQVLVEVYHGYSPYGQFYSYQISYFGLGLIFDM